MGCCEKLKYERLKEFSHASVLACQSANLLSKTLAVVKLNHHLYGDYYDGIDYDRAKTEGHKILEQYKPGDSMAVQKRNRNRRPKVSPKTK